MKTKIKNVFLLFVFAVAFGRFASAQGIENGQCHHAEAVAANDATVSALLDQWNSGCYRLDPVECKVLGELLVLCAEHPCPAPLYLVELTYPIRSYLCGVLVPAPGYVRVHVIIGGGSDSATVVEAPGL